MKKLLIIFALITAAKIFPTMAQENQGKDLFREKMVGQLNFNNEALKDSVALYTFNIQIRVASKNKKASAQSVWASDSIAYKVFKDFEVLKTSDYSDFTNGKSVTLIVVPIAIIVSNHPGRSSDPRIPIMDLKEKIERLFDMTGKERMSSDEIMYLAPVVIFTDKTVYD